MIDIAPLQGALLQFETSLRYLASEASRNDPELRVQFRAATIQAFEFTYELAVKMIVRQAAALAASPEDFKRQGFMEQMRAAARLGLVRDPAAFARYREERNKTSHTYDAGTAEQVLAVLPSFLDDVRHLVGRLQHHNRAGD